VKQVKPVRLAYLFPREMSTYGDRGNVICLMKRMEWRGIRCELLEFNPGDRLPKDIDLIFMGGGQDSGQRVIEESLKTLGPWLKDEVAAGTPGLMICGAYQLLGEYFETQSGDRLDGIGIFDAYTVAGKDRLIGNIRIKSEIFGDLIGFENHSGQTFLNQLHQALGMVRSGFGNNMGDSTEGIVSQHFIGTYLHGPLLPKNPNVADWLIAKAIGRTITELVHLPDQFIAQARSIASGRPQ